MWAGPLTFLLGGIAGVAITLLGMGLNKLMNDIRGGITLLHESVKQVAQNQHNQHSQVQSQNASILLRLNNVEKLVTPIPETPAPEQPDKLDNRSV